MSNRIETAKENIISYYQEFINMCMEVHGIDLTTIISDCVTAGYNAYAEEVANNPPQTFGKHLSKSIHNLKDGETVDWKFGLITRTIQRINETLYVIHDMSDGWLTADVTIEQLDKLLNGELLLTQLDWI